MMRAGKWTALRALWLAVTHGKNAGIPSVGAALSALPRLLRAMFGGQYRGVQGSTLAKMGVAAVYILSPVDLMPEMIVPLFGFADDAMVLAWLLGTVVNETAMFLRWEADQGRGASGARAQDGPTASTRNHPDNAGGQRIIPGEVIEPSRP